MEAWSISKFDQPHKRKKSADNQGVFSVNMISEEASEGNQIANSLKENLPKNRRRPQTGVQKNL